MDQTKKKVVRSKGEVAFRFLACTTIACALYYTPELRWTPDASDVPSVQVDAMLAASVPEATLAACASRDGQGLSIDASVRRN